VDERILRGFSVHSARDQPAQLGIPRPHDWTALLGRGSINTPAHPACIRSRPGEVDCKIKVWVAAYFAEVAALRQHCQNLGRMDMKLQIEPQHALSPNEIDAIEGCLYEHNSHVTGRHDGQGLGFVIRDELGRLIGVAAGYTWAGTSELKQMWVDKSYRGCGYARALLNAFISEASGRGVRRIWVASYDFQAPGLYEKAGFKRVAEFKEWPEGHTNVVLCKTLLDQKTDRPNVR
jgi:GNAT superfamily N-acetyltransferase